MRKALQWGREKLRAAGVDTPELDSEILLVHIYHSAIPQNRRMDRSWLFAHADKAISVVAFARYKKLIARRVKREPVAYIVGHKEFYGLDFLVNRNVLIPRPETELLVDEAKKQITHHTPNVTRYTIIDVGTGSGAIAVAVVKSLQSSVYSSQLRFFATDVSEEALCVARKNARKNGVTKRIEFLQRNLLESLFVKAELWREKSSALVIVANLPYLPTSEWRATMPEVQKYEPRQALDGGKDGLKYYRELFGQLHRWFHNSPQPSLISDAPVRSPTETSDLSGGDRSVPPLRVRGGEGALRVTIICEICPEQAGAFKKIVWEYFPKAQCKIAKDLSGRQRVATVYL